MIYTTTCMHNTLQTTNVLWNVSLFYLPCFFMQNYCYFLTFQFLLLHCRPLFTHMITAKCTGMWKKCISSFTSVDGVLVSDLNTKIMARHRQGVYITSDRGCLHILHMYVCIYVIYKCLLVQILMYTCVYQAH